MPTEILLAHPRHLGPVADTGEMVEATVVAGSLLAPEIISLHRLHICKKHNSDISIYICCIFIKCVYHPYQWCTSNIWRYDVDKPINTSGDADAMLVQFRRDVLITFIHHLRVTAWIEGHDHIRAIWATAGLEPPSPDEIYNPDWGVNDWDLKWKDIAGLDFAIYLDNMYQFGHLGLRDTGWEPMEDGTGYTWTSLVLMDMVGSNFLTEWSQGYGGEGQDSIARCLQVAELANARHVLETGDAFSPQLSARERGDEEGVDGLTIRQIALLAGMEEMSVRAAANPKRVNGLRTFSDNGRTRITTEVAREWLIGKGRYIPVRYFDSGRNNDLRKRSFSSLSEVVNYCRSKALGVAALTQGENRVLDQRVADFLEDGVNGVSNSAPWEPRQQREALNDPVFVEALADTLEVAAPLLKLRTREVLAKEELQRVQQLLRDMTAPVGAGHA